MWVRVPWSRRQLRMGEKRAGGDIPRNWSKGLCRRCGGRLGTDMQVGRQGPRKEPQRGQGPTHVHLRADSWASCSR